MQTPPLLTQWLSELTTANHSAHTLNAYHRDINSLINFLNHEGLIDGLVEGIVDTTNLQHTNNNDKLSRCLNWSVLTTVILQSYVSHRLEQDDISPNSVQRELSSLRQFYSWLMQHNYISTNPLVGFKIKRTPRKLPEMVDIDVISQLLDQPAPSKGADALALWHRDKAMLELLYSSGLRVAELTALTYKDIDFSAKQLRVQAGKGNKTRILPIGGKALTALNQWLPTRANWLTHETNSSEIAVFISKPTKTRPSSALSTRTVQRRIQHHAQRAGIDKRMYPHLLRHCFASHMLSGSGDLRAVQELLGHANISTTQIYTHLDFDKLSQVYDNSHPRAKRSPK